MGMTSNIKVLLILLINFSGVWSYNILMICPPPARSHHNLCTGIVDILGDNGHNMTFVSPYPKENSKHREIGVPELVKMKDAGPPGFSLATLSKLDTIKFLTNWQPAISEKFFANEGVKKLLSDPNENFDLVIYEYFMNEYLLGFSVHFDTPSIILSPVPMMLWLTTMTGNSLSIATAPNVFTQFSKNMNLWQRTMNAIVSLIQELMGKFLLEPIFKGLYDKYFPTESEKVPFGELKNRIDAIFVNSHPVLSGARPLLPNTIEIGGYHIKEPEPLPEDLKKIMDNAKEGIIYFSMGSNLKSSEMTPELRRAFLEAFASVRQTVLWKYEEDLPNKPKNVVIKKWMPQTAILAHPNVKLFISHGGLLSCTEATRFGVPLFIIPVFGDQHHNAIGVNEREQGVFTQFDNVTLSSLEWGIGQVLNNKKYAENAKKLQKLFIDRPMTPHDTVKFYTEHVVRTGGAKHLSPPKLSRCSLLLLDVAAVLLIPLAVIFSLVVFCCKKCCCAKKSPQNNKKSAQSKKTN